MVKNDSEEKENSRELKKIWTKKFNLFLSNYFNWFIFLIVVLILVLGFFYLLKPKYEQTVQYVNIINQQGALDFEAKKAELAKIKELLSTYQNLDKASIDKMNYITPVIQNKEELFTEINYLVAKSQLTLQSVSLAEAGSYQDRGIFKAAASKNNLAGKIEVVSINLSVLGTDYGAFKNFLSVLENNLRLMDVVNLSFNPSGQSTNLTLNVYYLKAQ